MPKFIRDCDIMDRIVVIGLNHKTAPVEIREKFASVCVDGTTPLEHISKLQPVKEVFFVSTCKMSFQIVNWQK